MSAFHVDEAAGSDTAGAGTPDAPYQSIAFALFTHGQDAKVLVRKDANTPYDEPTQSALKKAKKGADGLEKKKKKAEELAEREAKAKGEERERREQNIEESKKIKLVEDESLPKAVKVSGCFLIVPRRTIHVGWPRQKLSPLRPYARNEFACSDGYIVCDRKRISSSSFYAMELVTFKRSYLVKLCVPRIPSQLFDV